MVFKLAQSLLIASSVFALIACKELKEDKRGTASNSAEATAKSAECTDENCDKVETKPLSDGIGLTDFCTFAPADGGKGCFTCTPRELPNVQCVDIPAGFDPAGKCQHDLDRLTCDLGAAKPFVIEFSDRSPDEDVYEKMDLLVFGAKALLYKKLDGKPELRDLAYSLLESIAAHKLALFTGGDVGPVINEAKPLMKILKPDLTEAQIEAIKVAAQSVAKAFAAKRAAGPITHADAFAILSDVYKTLPPDLFGTLLADAHLEDFVKNLEGKSAEDILGELSKSLGGDEAMMDIMTQLGASMDSGDDIE